MTLWIRNVKEVNYIDFFLIIVIIARNITKDFNINVKGGEEETLLCTWCFFIYRGTATSITPLVSFYSFISLGRWYDLIWLWVWKEKLKISSSAPFRFSGCLLTHREHTFVLSLDLVSFTENGSLTDIWSSPIMTIPGWVSLILGFNIRKLSYCSKPNSSISFYWYLAS